MIITSLRRQAAFIEKRKAELGYEGTDYVAVNPGHARTSAKRALLRTLEKTPKSKRRRFSAKY